MKWELVKVVCTKPANRNRLAVVALQLQYGSSTPQETSASGPTLYEAAIRAVIAGVTRDTYRRISWLSGSYDEKRTVQEGYKISLALAKGNCPFPFKGCGEADTQAQATVLACLDAINGMQSL